MSPTTTKVNWGVALTLALAVIGWLCSGFASYAQVEHRVTAVETKVESADKRLERMESKIDRLLERAK